MGINIAALNAHLNLYDANKDGELDDNELQEMQKTTAQIGALLTGGTQKPQKEEALSCSYFGNHLLKAGKYIAQKVVSIFS